MRKITFLKTTILIVTLVLCIFTARGQGNETFTHTSTTASYITITWPGTNGLTWTATDARGDQTITTSNKAICIRQNAGKITGPLTTAQQSAGVGVVTFTAKNTAATSDNTKATTYQFKCGSVTKSITIPAMGTNSVQVTSPAINSNDAQSIEITILDAAGVRITIDDLSWTAAASCTSSNLAFASTTVNKTTADAPFTQVATSLNTTAAVTYTSNNSAIATVNATTGEVTIVAAGTAKITATQAAGTHNNVDYCAATAEYTLNVVSVTPTITVTEVNVPAMTAFVDGTDTEVINVSGINLAESILLAISGTDAAQFALSANTVAQTDGTASNTAITISYNPTAAGSHTAILTISTAGAVSVTRALTGTATWTPLAVPFATAATGISSTGFSANWEAVAGATNYDLNVYTKTGNNEGFYNAPAAPSGWTLTGVTSYTATSIGLFGNSAPSVKFDDTNDVVVSPVYEVAPNLVSFWLRGASTNATSALLFQGYDGANWVTIENIQPLPTVGTIKVYNSTSTPALQNNFVQFRFTYAKSSGNVAFDDFGAYIVTPVLGSPFTITGETSKEIAGLNPGTTYYYTVVAKNANVTSAVSNEVSVVTTDISTGVHNPLNNISVSVSGNNILFTAQAGQMVEVYNSIGQKLVSKRAVEGLNSIPVTARGVVLVKVGDRLAKVIM